jgi:hypothetical protein
MTWLEGWQNFYVILGSAAAALTGLMFVVTALIADFRGTEQQLEAFGTPTVVHFSAALLESLTLTIPWRGMLALRMTIGLFSLAGVVYGVLVARRARRQADYAPVFEDWLFHAILPLSAYVGIAFAALLLPRWPAPVMFVFAGAGVVLVFVGLHNAWDTVKYVLVRRWEKSNKEPD